MALPDGGLESAGGDHFFPGSGWYPAALPFAPFTGWVSGTGVFGGTQTFGGGSAWVTASTEGIVTTDMQTAKAAATATRRLRGRVNTRTRRDN
ncbi:hypothetical protein GCM10018790_31720 [Kitasatospora xanthocidica]|nr:hypothetical protein GCM10018790_31720 [Kitasatospora xanthocidica]